ncbi:BatD family protein [Nitrospira sp. Ecomares 2.1]
MGKLRTRRVGGWWRAWVPLVITPIILIMTVPPATAQEPFARARIHPEGLVTVGQPVELVVEVFVSTWFAGAPQFPSLNIDNALVIPPGRSSNLNEEVNGEKFFGITRSYTLYPQVPGRYQVPSIEVRIKPGLAKTTTVVRTPPLTLEAGIPREARGLPYFIGAKELTVSQIVQPTNRLFKVGDVITRTVTTTVYDSLSLVLPSVKFLALPGLAVYPSPPVVTDEGGERGERIKGQRTDAATYVMQEEGDYELPAVEVVWWDVANLRIQRSTAPSISFHVDPDPAYGAEFALSDKPDSGLEKDMSGGNGREWGPWVLTIIPLMVAAILLGLNFRYGSHLTAWWQEKQRRHRQSESVHFSAFRRACRKHDPREAMQCLLTWLEHVCPFDRTVTVSWLVTENSAPDLAAAVSELEARLYGPSPPAESWNGDALYQSVSRQRKRLLSSSSIQQTQTMLQPLNPSTGVSG